MSDRLLGLLTALVLAGLATAAGRAWHRAPLALYQSATLPAPVDPERPIRPLWPAEKSRVILVDVVRAPDDAAAILSRRELAQLVTRITERGACAVGLDITFDEPRDAAGDEAFARALRASGRVVLATRYDAATRAERPPVFAADAAALGVANLVLDAHDGQLRDVQHYYEQAGMRTRHSLTVELARRALAFPSPEPAAVALLPDALAILAPGGPALTVPVDEQGLTRIAYLGPAGAIPTLGWRDVMQAPPGKPNLTGKVALLGNTSLGIRDAYHTPFHRASLARISGVEIHAQMIASVLTGRQVTTTGRAFDFALALLGVALGAAAAARWYGWRGFALCALACALAVLASFRWYRAELVMASPLPFALGVAAGHACVLALAGWRAARERDSALARRHSLEDTLARVDRGDWDGAYPALAALDVEPAPPPAATWALACYHLRRGEVDSAKRHFTRLSLAALPAGRLRDLAAALEERGAYDDAARAMRAVVDAEPASAADRERLRALEELDGKVPRELRRALAGRYESIAYLGAGGMACVFCALDTRARRRVAVKVPSPQFVQDLDARQRFVREAQALASVQHPHVVRLFDVGGEDFPYFTMELVEGRTLAHTIALERPLTESRALEIFTPLAAALAACHAKGVVHRDFKPENVMMAADGPRLMDFGLAFLAERTRITRDSLNVGTPNFMAPELLEGGEPTPAVDVYAFGTAVFDALAGEMPFGSQPFLVRVAKPANPLAAVRPDVTPALAALVDRCLARDPAQRFADAGALHAALTALRPRGE